MRSTQALGFLLAGLLALPACHADPRPNVLLITLDTTRADRLGAMGDSEARTPTLDALAARGVLFERAYASTSRTLPSHSTILTGLEIHQHRVRDNGQFLARDAGETLAERLGARGYATAAFVAAAVLDSVFGLDRGFDVYDDDIPWDQRPLSRMVPQRRGEVVVDSARAWLEKRPRDPFFLWVHLYDAHSPRDPPAPFAAMEDRYAAEIAYADAQVARLLDAVEQATAGQDTLIVVIGDHGESLGEHDEPTHGITAYDSTLHVPLIAVGPGFPPGERTARFVQSVDVTPTILAAVGEDLPAGIRGVPLQRQHSDAEPGERVGYFESFGAKFAYGWAGIAGVRTDRWKYTAEPHPIELYDVLADPAETLNRAEDTPEVVERLAAHYEALRLEDDEAAQPPEALPLEIAQKLSALGYVAVPQQFDPGQTPDPRRFVGALGWIDAALQVAGEGRLAEGIQALEILAKSPVIRAPALNDLAAAYLAAGRAADAADAYAELVSLSGTGESRLGLARALLQDNHPEQALLALEPLVAEGGEASAVALGMRAFAYLALDRIDEALEAARAALDADPTNEAAHAVASHARAVLGGAAAEIERLEKDLASSPDAARIRNTRALLAELLLAEGRDREALRVLEANPAPTAGERVLLAEIAREHGNLPRAAELYRAALAEQPTALDWRRELAGLEVSLGQWEAALALYDELVVARPSDAELRLDRGVALLLAGRAAEAEADYRLAASIDEALPEAHFNLGLLELESGREAEAERDLLRAVELRPEYGKAHFHLARIYRRRGDPRAAAHAERAAASSAEAVGAPPPAPTPNAGGS
jgi:arylsulfatase A-like enzyme/Tfp pilus assembly protein PilF